MTGSPIAGQVYQTLPGADSRSGASSGSSNNTSRGDDSAAANSATGGNCNSSPNNDNGRTPLIHGTNNRSTPPIHGSTSSTPQKANNNNIVNFKPNNADYSEANNADDCQTAHNDFRALSFYREAQHGVPRGRSSGDDSAVDDDLNRNAPTSGEDVAGGILVRNLRGVLSICFSRFYNKI
jgi:hypothetical protein